jgi:carbonic anhydrase
MIGRMKANAVRESLIFVFWRIYFGILGLPKLNKGPQTWSKMYSGARGHHQSPINIETPLAIYDAKLNRNPLVIDYDHHSCSQIRNTGFFVSKIEFQAANLKN